MQLQVGSWVAVAVRTLPSLGKLVHKGIYLKKEFLQIVEEVCTVISKMIRDL